MPSPPSSTAATGAPGAAPPCCRLGAASLPGTIAALETEATIDPPIPCRRMIGPRCRWRPRAEVMHFELQLQILAADLVTCAIAAGGPRYRRGSRAADRALSGGRGRRGWRRARTSPRRRIRARGTPGRGPRPRAPRCAVESATTTCAPSSANRRAAAAMPLPPPTSPPRAAEVPCPRAPGRSFLHLARSSGQCSNSNTSGSGRTGTGRPLGTLDA